MSTRSCFRGPFDKWHGKQTETLLKSEQQHLYHIYWSLSRQLSWKNSLLVICKMLELFVNPLTSIDLLFLIETSYSNIFRCNYLRNEKYFLNFFGISKFRFNFEHFQKKKKMRLIANVFLNLQTRKDVIR